MRELRAREIKTVTDESCSLVSAVEPLMNVLGYLEHVVNLNEPVVHSVADYRSDDHARFVLHQHELDGLPGIMLDSFDDDGPVWLRVERVQTIEPPSIDADLAVWIEVSTDPDRPPSVHESVMVTVDGAEKDRLVEAKQARAVDLAPAINADRRYCNIFNVRLRLADYPILASRLDAYIAGPWTKWAHAEKLRRRTNAIHARLSDILPVGDPTDRTYEIVWGLGVSRWRREGNEIVLPVLERSVAVETGENGEIRIRPSMAGAIADLRGFQAGQATGPSAAVESSRRVLEAIERDGEVSPFVPDSYEPVLRIVSSQLDPEGRYLGSDRDWCKPGEDTSDVADHLAVSDRWVIFARPRTKCFVLRDIKRFRDEIERIATVDGEIPMLARVLAFGASEEGSGAIRQALSGVIGRPIDMDPVAEPASAETGDLFFPLPSNADQIDVVRRLQTSDGLVVRAAPGPAKTNAIVNVVCHYLALGQRVLVVCREGATLRELHDKFPAAIRDLTIGLTGDDRQELAQVEAAVRRLQSIVETIKPRDHVELINKSEREVIATRRMFSDLTEEAAGIARSTPGFAELPLDLSWKLIVEADVHAWFEDRPPGLLSDTGISLAAVDVARTSRIKLGPDLCHIDDDLPELALLPEPAAIVRMHQDLAEDVESKGESKAESKGESKGPSTESKERSLARRAVTLLDASDAIRFADDLEALAAAHVTVGDEAWLDPTFPLRKHEGGPRAESAALVEFARDATSQLSRRATFLLRPVDVPADALNDQAVFDVVARLSLGEKVFTTFAAREKRQKPVVAAMTIAGVVPASRDDWQHVRDYLAWRRDIHALNARWRALAVELGAPSLTAEYPQMIYGIEKIVRSINVAIVTAAVAERNINSVAGSKLLMSRGDIDGLLANVGELQKLGAAVRFAVIEREASRLELARLKEMFAGEGVLPAAVRDEVLARIGHADADQIRESWTRLRGQIARLNDRHEDFDHVRTVGKALAGAGAPIFARRVTTEVVQSGGVDQVFAGDWAAAWNWAALSRQLKEMGEEQHLRQLATRREQLEKTLRQQFETVVTARTDFAAAQSLSSTVRRALAIFMIAIRKMASATDGLAAHHHRRVAREALDGCCDGIPCWIMPSWRVAERLPAKLGAFDLVIVDEASGSNVSELAALLRGRKILVIGDDKQVEAPPLQINHSRMEGLGDVFLRALPRTIRPFVLPGSSLYDLAKVMFPGNQIHLREDAHAYRDPIGATPHSADSWQIAATGPAEDAHSYHAVDLFAVHDEPWDAPRTSTHSEADLLADEISKVVALLPNNNRLKPRDAVLMPADRKPAPWDPVLNEAPPIADHHIAKVDWPPSGRSSETDVKFAVLPPLRDDKQSRGFGSQQELPETGSAEAEAPPWLLRPRFGDDVVRPGAVRANETPAEGEVRATGPEQNVVPQPREADARWSVKRRVVAIAAVFPLMLLLGGAYWQFGPEMNSRFATVIANWSPSQFVLAKSSDISAQSDDQSTPLTSVQPKNVITTRVDPPATSESASIAPVAASVAAPVTQRAVLYEEDPTDPKGKRYTGGVTWRTENIASTAGTPAELVVKADLNVTDAKTAVSMTFRRNTDRAMPASHVVEIKFDRPRDNPAGDVSKLRGLLMKQEGKVHGAPLEGESAKVTPGYFMIALASGAPQLQRNLKLLKDYPGFEVVVDYSNGSKAILLIDKGSSGEKAFKEAFAAWGQ